MRTKVVYVLVSNGEDYYTEQLYISLVSLKQNSPHSVSYVVVDRHTEKVIQKSKTDLLSYIGELVVVDVPEEYTGAKSSRYLKTSLRKYISGPYLFVDTDTIIAEPLDDIDKMIDQDIDVAAIRDAHCSFKKMPNYAQVMKRANKLGWGDIGNDEIHFNSGVMFVADSLRAHDFYNRWHENWLYEQTKGFYFDQLAMHRSNHDMDIITEMDGKWNFILFFGALRYLYSSKIIHYGGTIRDTEAYYFRKEEVFSDIKKNGILSDMTIYHLKHPKEAFVSNVLLVGEDDYRYFHSMFHNEYIYHRKRFLVIDSILVYFANLKSRLMTILK